MTPGLRFLGDQSLLLLELQVLNLVRLPQMLSVLRSPALVQGEARVLDFLCDKITRACVDARLANATREGAAAAQPEVLLQLLLCQGVRGGGARADLDFLARPRVLAGPAFDARGPISQLLHGGDDIGRLLRVVEVGLCVLVEGRVVGERIQLALQVLHLLAGR